MVCAPGAQMQKVDFVQIGLPVSWISLLFGIQKPTVVYLATVDLISKVT
jgi:hypothetical protein